MLKVKHIFRESTLAQSVKGFSCCPISVLQEFFSNDNNYPEIKLYKVNFNSSEVDPWVNKYECLINKVILSGFFRELAINARKEPDNEGMNLEYEVTEDAKGCNIKITQDRPVKNLTSEEPNNIEHLGGLRTFQLLLRKLNCRFEYGNTAGKGYFDITLPLNN